MDAVDKALQELAEFAAQAWSNNAIVDRIEAVRALRAAEVAAANAQAAHAQKMRDEVCMVMGITPGALMGLPNESQQPSTTARTARAFSLENPR
jgi:hypothetical protein